MQGKKIKNWEERERLAPHWEGLRTDARIYRYHNRVSITSHNLKIFKPPENVVMFNPLKETTRSNYQIEQAWYKEGWDIHQDKPKATIPIAT